MDKEKQILELRNKVILAEQQRLNGAKTLSLLEARAKLKERLEDYI